MIIRSEFWKSIIRWLRGWAFRKRRHGPDCMSYPVDPAIAHARAAYDAKRRAKRASSGELRELQKMREIGLRAEVARRAG